MRIGKNQSLWTSVILHVAVLIALFLSTVVEAFLPKETQHVFEMVSEPNSQTIPLPQEATIPEFKLPDVSPMAEIPDPVLPQPKTVTLQPTTQAVAEEKLISMDDFRKQNPTKPQPPRPPQNQRKPVQVTQIDTSKYSSNLQNNLPSTVNSSSPRMTAAQRTALQRYSDQLNAQLNRAWVKPVNLAGVKLIVTVIFDVSSSGLISNVRLSPASGNASFDASVKAAFARVRSAGVTPTGQQHSFKLSFKMLD
jgi:TonB family protein